MDTNTVDSRHQGASSARRRIAVAGATGVVGRHVVEVASERGYDVVPLARAAGVDLATGEGLEEHLAGVDAVIDVTGTPTQDRATSETFFGAVTRTLLAHERAAGVGHHVALSIVGIDDVPSGYYAGKRLQERLLVEQPEAEEQPWSLLRTTQFHEFAEQVLHFARVGPVSVVPRMRSQPVSAREVAGALVDLVERGPSGWVEDLAGPQERWMHELARLLVRARGQRRLVVAVPGRGEAGRAMRRGALCAVGDGPRGRVGFEEWLGA